MTQQGRGALTITVVEGKPQATTITYTITAQDDFGSPADLIRVTGALTVVNNDNNTFTLGRAASGGGTTAYGVVASKAGASSVSAEIDVPEQDAGIPPALSGVSLGMTSTTATLVYTYTGTPTYALNGTNQGAAAEPLAVGRPFSGNPDDSYVLTITGANGATLQYAFTVPAQPASGTAATDLPTCMALSNAMHAVLVAKGWMT